MEQQNKHDISSFLYITIMVVVFVLSL